MEATENKLVALRANEKIKATSSLISNLGMALSAAGFARWFLEGADPWVMIWIVFGATMAAAGIHLLSYLVGDDGSV